MEFVTSAGGTLFICSLVAILTIYLSEKASDTAITEFSWGEENSDELTAVIKAHFIELASQKAVAAAIFALLFIHLVLK
jgi:hypothetical protein